ncbi:hypothetical protein J3E73DRAFT_358833 [Bipolaris maydis]|nr:hypothetical protein J3E73DRAFT_358833 [Bipolaris maydis]
MDVVLEVADTFIFDPLYAKLLPAYPAALVANATLSSIREEPTAYARPHATWHYEPATQFFSTTPSKYAYMSQWPRDDWRRRGAVLVPHYLLSTTCTHPAHTPIHRLFGVLVYYIFASASYFFIFDKSTFNHPRYLKNQIKLEMKQANIAFPIMAIFTVPFFLAEVRGYSKLYDTVDQATHKWIMPTPYASHAFHPLDGYAQGLPYHIFPFLFPLSKFAYVLLFVTVNIWTVLIHDGEYAHNSAIINGAACHTMHHLYFNYNYGQFTTLWDRLGGSYRKPNDELFQKELKMCQSEWKKQAEAVDKMVLEVEGGTDDRTYSSDEPKKVR